MSTAADLQHAVHLYGTEDSLFTTVAGFLSQGLIDGQPTILVATAEHSAPILEHLSNRMIDVSRALEAGHLFVLDAHLTLAQFMVDDMPDPVAFEATVGSLIGSIQREGSERTLIRAYGEMVNVLVKQGRPNAAIRLEELWNGLATRYSFTLLCGYAMDSFHEQGELFEEVCRQHSHILPSAEPIAGPAASFQP